MNLIEDAMDAFALLQKMTCLGYVAEGGLFTARSLGRDIDSIGERFGELSSIESASALTSPTKQ